MNDCDACDNTGRIHCDTCAGLGFFPPQDEDDVGDDCYDCDGIGKRDCPECEGAV